MLLRRLTEAGFKEFEAAIANLNAGMTTATPSHLLQDPLTSAPIEGDIEITSMHFGNRFNAAQYLSDVFVYAGITGLDSDLGVWAWLSLFFFDELCPADKKGQRSPGRLYRWIPSTNWKDRHRHLLSGPYTIFQFYKDDPSKAMIVLCNPLDSPGDFVEQLASRQEILTNRAVMGGATKLYYDVEKGKARRGSSPNQHKPGTLRRYIDVLQQYDLTWDLYAMDTQSLLNILPKEFHASA